MSDQNDNKKITEVPAGEREKTGVSVFSVLMVFLRLGLTSFGGPVAHLGYFHNEFVVRRKWMDATAYADLVALCQFLPGPASSQVGIGIGLSKAGFAGALAAWFAFTLPSALLLTLFGLGMTTLDNGPGDGWLYGLKVAAVAVVAQALWSMWRSLCPDIFRTILAVLAAAFLILFPGASGQVAVIVAGGLAGWACLSATQVDKHHVDLTAGIGTKTAISALGLFFILLLGLPALAAAFPGQILSLIDSFYRSGSLVFGGGHVVLPLLQSEVVPPGWVSQDAFLAGYGAAQAVPGPLFTFSAYLGAVMGPVPNGFAGAAICLVAIFAPSFLLVVGVLPFWDRLRRIGPVRAALGGVNGAVVGLLAAAFYDPVWTGTIFTGLDFALAVVLFVLLVPFKAPPWAVVILASAAGAALTGLGFYG